MKLKQHEFNLLLSSLDNALEILARHRTPDQASVTALDTLKQARARVIATVGTQVPLAPVEELAAA